MEELDESQIRSGEYPPPEVIAQQLSEVACGKRISQKTWLDDWYARRFETEREPDTSVTEDDTTDIDEKPPVVEDVERDLERELSEDEMKVAKRIEIVEDAHPDKGVVELSAEYDAIDYMEVVESTLHCVRE